MSSLWTSHIKIRWGLLNGFKHFQSGLLWTFLRLAFVFRIYKCSAYQKVLAFFPSNRKALELMTNFITRYHWFFSSLLATILYHGNPDWKHKLWNIVSTVLHIQVLLEYCYIWMESSEWKHCHHLFYHRKALFSTGPMCQFLGFCQGMNDT